MRKYEKADRFELAWRTEELMLLSEEELCEQVANMFGVYNIHETLHEDERESIYLMLGAIENSQSMERESRGKMMPTHSFLVNL